MELNPGSASEQSICKSTTTGNIGRCKGNGSILDIFTLSALISNWQWSLAALTLSKSDGDQSKTQSMRWSLCLVC